MSVAAEIFDIDREEIEQQLDRIIESSDFNSTDRLRKILRFIVTETLDGRSRSIKAYSIALAVFGRDENFDANTDPIVRIEAGRLRRALERYYLTAGANDPVRITVPKGAYVPVFERIEHAPPARPPEASTASPPAPPSRHRARKFAYAAVALAVFLVLLTMAWPALEVGTPKAESVTEVRTTAGSASPGSITNPDPAVEAGPSILVLPFANMSGDPANDHVADGLTAEFVAALTRFDRLLVYGVETGLHYGRDPDLAVIGQDLGVGYVLSGTIRLALQEIRVTAALLSVPDGRLLWSRSFSHAIEDANVLTVQDDIADEVARILGDTYGVIYQQEIDAARHVPPATWSAYRCVLGSYRYWREPTPEQHAVIRDCLERAVAENPDYAEAWANLALTYIDEYRYGFNPRPDDPSSLARALAAARRAVSLAPDGVRGYQALHLVHWLQHDIENSFDAAERALALNPHNTEVIADIGLRYIVLGDFERGLPLLDEAFARNPQQNDFYLFGYVILHYARQDYETALTYARRIDISSCPWCSHVALAAIYGQLGWPEEARRFAAGILALDPDFLENGAEELARRNLPPDLIDHFVEGLRKAGLPVAGRSGATSAEYLD